MEQNYLPLFRKYRPQSFKDIVGQESLVKALSNAIELNRIINAYLFCGPRGTGKTSSARIFAKSLNCEHGPTLEPCQKCASCIDITNASGLDVIEIDAASNRGIQDAKDLISKVQYAPINGKYKIFIIDEVHMLSNDAFNALLKTFEEPPKNVIFILATTEPHKVLETIVSRCQRFDLRRITTDDIIKRLREISNLENIKITDDALFTIAKNVSGGLRDSLALLDQVSILGVKDEITKDLIEELLGKVNFDVLLNLLKYIDDENIELSLNAIDEIYSKGNEPRNLAENFIEFLRNVILVLNSSQIDSISKFTTLIKEDIEKIKNLGLDKNKTIKILNVLIEYYKEIKISSNPYLWMELAVIAACRLDLKNLNREPAVEKISHSNSGAIPKSEFPINSKTEVVSSAADVPLDTFIPNPIESVSNRSEDTTAQNFTPDKTTNIISNSIQNSKPEIEEHVDTTKSSELKPQIPQIQENNELQSPKNETIQTQTPQAPAAINQDGAEIWTNIIAAIPSLPAKAFYSGVAKLVKVDNQTITLGFLHENALTQAKSDSKLSQLNAGIQSSYAGFNVEFTKIDASTRTVEVKPKISNHAQPQKPTAEREFENRNSSQNIAQDSRQTSQNTAQNSIKEGTAVEFDDTDEEPIAREKKYYSPKVQEMIEQFNGRIIE